MTGEPPGGPSAARRWLTLALGLLVSAGLFALVLSRVEVERLRADLAAAVLWPLGVSLLVKLAGLGAMAWRLTALLRPAGGVALGTAFHGQLLGFAANNLVPFRLGELAKVDSVARRAERARATVLGAAATERLLDAVCLLAMLAAVAPVAMPRLERPWIAGGAIVTLTAGGAAWWLASRPESLRRLLDRAAEATGLGLLSRVGAASQAFAEGLEGLRSPWITLEALAASALYWACSFLSITLWLEAFSLEAPWFAPAVILVFLAFGTAIPASPGFIGTYDFFFLTALGLFGIGASEGAGMVLVGHTLNVVPFTLLGVAVAPGEIRDLSRRVRASLTNARRSAQSR